MRAIWLGRITQKRQAAEVYTAVTAFRSFFPLSTWLQEGTRHSETGDSNNMSGNTLRKGKVVEPEGYRREFTRMILTTAMAVIKMLGPLPNAKAFRQKQTFLSVAKQKLHPKLWLISRF